jgi:hypothetical protein
MFAEFPLKLTVKGTGRKGCGRICSGWMGFIEPESGSTLNAQSVRTVTEPDGWNLIRFVCAARPVIRSGKQRSLLSDTFCH